MASKRKKLSAKDKLMRKIRVTKASAASLRLSGFIPNASFHEQVVDRLVHDAERKGWGDDAVLAEEQGLKWAERHHK
jgi:hypothetical protein